MWHSDNRPLGSHQCYCIHEKPSDSKAILSPYGPLHKLLPFENSGWEDSTKTLRLVVNLEYKWPTVWIHSVLILYEFVPFIRVEKFWLLMHRRGPDVRNNDISTAFFLEEVAIKFRLTLVWLFRGKSVEN